MAIDHLGEEHMDQKVFIGFAKFETRQREVKYTQDYLVEVHIELWEAID